MVPKDLKVRLANVAARRCVECHKGGNGKANLPLAHFTRITNPELNDFLVAPLAKAAGGREFLPQDRLRIEAGPRLPGAPQMLRACRQPARPAPADGHAQRRPAKIEPARVSRYVGNPAPSAIATEMTRLIVRSVPMACCVSMP